MMQISDGWLVVAAIFAMAVGFLLGVATSTSAGENHCKSFGKIEFSGQVYSCVAVKP